MTDSRTAATIPSEDAPDSRVRRLPAWSSEGEGEPKRQSRIPDAMWRSSEIVVDPGPTGTSS